MSAQDPRLVNTKDGVKRQANSSVDTIKLLEQSFGIDSVRVMPQGLNVFQSYLVKTYKYNNQFNFFQLWQPQWKQFGYNTVLEWLSWSNGNSQRVHTVGKLIPTFLAPKLIGAIVDLVMAGGINYDVTNDEIDEDKMVELEKTREALPNQDAVLSEDVIEFIDKWSEDTNFNSRLYETVRYVLEGGTALLKANIDLSGNVWFDSSRIDRFVPTFDGKGKLLRVRIYTDLLYTIQSTASGGENEVNTNYMLTEDRYYNDLGLPVIKYSIYKDSATVTSKSFYNSTAGGSIRFQALPKAVQQSFKENYGTKRLDEEEELSFDDIGCYVLKRTENSTVIPDIPLGDSILVDNIPHLLKYDLVMTKHITDIYIASGKVYLPSHSSPSNFMGDGLERSVEKQVNFGGNANGGGASKPEAVQFELRSDQWKILKEEIYTDLSLGFRIGLGYLVPHLSSGVEKTATEISAEENMTTSTIENLRTLISSGVNNCLNLVLKHYNAQITNGVEYTFNDLKYRVKVMFSKAGLTNITNRIDQSLKQYEKGTQSLFKTIQNINPDWSKQQVDEEIERIKLEALEHNVPVNQAFLKDNLNVNVAQETEANGEPVNGGEKNGSDEKQVNGVQEQPPKSN